MPKQAQRTQTDFCPSRIGVDRFDHHQLSDTDRMVEHELKFFICLLVDSLALYIDLFSLMLHKKYGKVGNVSEPLSLKCTRFDAKILFGNARTSVEQHAISTWFDLSRYPIWRHNT